MGSQSAADLISLPQGGGAVRGLGETFSPDLHTGTGNLRVPLNVPAGRAGLQPAFALAYSSGSPNGPFGLGWTLDVPGIRRKTAKQLPRYDGTDVFVLSGAEDLVPVPGGAIGHRHYRPVARASSRGSSGTPPTVRTTGRSAAATGCAAAMGRRVRPMPRRTGATRRP